MREEHPSFHLSFGLFSLGLRLWCDHEFKSPMSLAKGLFDLLRILIAGKEKAEVLPPLRKRYQVFSGPQADGDLLNPRNPLGLPKASAFF